MSRGRLRRRLIAFPEIAVARGFGHGVDEETWVGIHSAMRNVGAKTI
jgi:hypothetical protein